MRPSSTAPGQHADAALPSTTGVFGLASLRQTGTVLTPGDIDGPAAVPIAPVAEQQSQAAPDTSHDRPRFQTATFVSPKQPLHEYKNVSQDAVTLAFSPITFFGLRSLPNALSPDFKQQLYQQLVTTHQHEFATAHGLPPAGAGPGPGVHEPVWHRTLSQEAEQELTSRVPPGQRLLQPSHPRAGDFSTFEYQPSEYERDRLQHKISKLKSKLSQLAPTDFVVKAPPQAPKGAPAFCEYEYPNEPYVSRVRQRLQHEMAARAASLAGPFVPSGRADPLAMMRGRAEDCMLALCRQLSDDWPTAFLQVFEDRSGALVLSFDRTCAVVEGDLSAYMQNLAKNSALVAEYHLAKDGIQWGLVDPETQAVFYLLWPPWVRHRYLAPALSTTQQQQQQQQGLAPGSSPRTTTAPLASCSPASSDRVASFPPAAADSSAGDLTNLGALSQSAAAAGYGPTSLMPKSEGGKETPGSQSSAMATLPYVSPPILVLNASTSFVEWKGNAQGALMMAGCWSAMCGTDSDPARNERAYAWLLCCCKGHYLSMVQAAKTAPAAWKALLADQQRTGFSHCSELWHQINHLQLGSGESISQLCSRLSDLVLELAEADETVSEAVQVRALLQAVPSLPPYDMAREFITQGADASAPSLADVKRRLQNAEARVRNQQPAQLAAIHAPRRSSASPASSSSRHSAAKPGADPSPSSPSPTALSRVKCFKCGKRGHIARDCKEPGGSSSSGSSSGGGGGAAGGGAGGGSGVPSNRGADKGRAASSATAGLFHAKLMAMQAVPSSGASGSGGASGSSGSKGGAVHNGAAGGGAGGEVQCCWSHAAGLSSLYPCVSAKPTPSLAAAAQVAAMPRSLGLLSSERFWLADSGASHHITPDRSLLHDFQAVEQPVSLALGKNTARLVAHGVGNVRLVSESGQCFTLRGVLWAPDAAANYLSTVVADLAGWRVVQEGGGIRIEDRANPARFCVKGALVGRSYLIRCSAEPAVVGCEPPATAHAVTAETPQLLHERLGHLSYGAMADLIGKGMVSGVSISAAQCKAAGSGVCPGCAAGKMHRRVADTLPSLAPPVKGVLDLVHTDVCGPFHVASVGGYSYIVTFLDEYSGLSLVECVKAKSDVPGVIISTVQWLETQSGRRLKALRSDNGTEYINQEVRAFLASKGIQHQRSAPYSPEQNGSAERLNRTLIEKVRCMLYTAGLPARLWTEAVRTANHLRNLSPMRGKGATPWELFFGVKPDISALRVFGATAYAHVPQHMRSKLEGKAVQGVLVGYEMGSKAYRVLVPGGRIIVTKDVVFDELARGEPLPVSEVAEVMATAEELSVHIAAAEPSPEPATGGAGGEAVGADSSGADSGAGSAASAGGGGAGASAAEPAACPVPLRQSLRLQGLPPAGSLAACVLELPAAAVPIPHTILEARASALAEQWAVATDAEMESLHGHRTWELVDPPQGCRPLDNRWVFSVKEDSQGHIARLKARLVVKGFMQREGVDFTELHAPVSKHATVRALLATAAAWDMDLEHLDVKTAFLNGYLDEEIYMKQPAGYEDGSARVCRLKRALYGLRQAPRAWHARLKAELEQLGFAASAADSCLFTMVRGNSKVLLAVYVDDCLLAVSKGDAETMAWVKQRLAAVFDIHQLGSAERFLGMEIVRDRAAGRLVLSQERYAASVVDRFGLADARPKATPLSTSEQLVREGEVVLRMGEHSYAELVGSLMHLAVCTRPDIAHAVGLCAKYMAAPTQQHWQALRGVLRYVASTVSYGLAFGGAEGLVGFCDADFAGDLDTRRSTTGFVFTMHGAAVSWSSRRQPTVAVSTTEAEYMAASAAAKEALWLRVLLADLSVGSAVEPVTIMCDNEAAITLIKHPIASARSKHIDVLHHFVRERAARGELVFKYLASGANVADAMTKALPGVKYEFCKSGMGMVKL